MLGENKGLPVGGDVVIGFGFGPAWLLGLVVGSFGELEGAVDGERVDDWDGLELLVLDTQRGGCKVWS